MNWGSAAEFFAMGGYALYVWGAYGVAAACIVLELWAVLVVAGSAGAIAAFLQDADRSR